MLSCRAYPSGTVSDRCNICALSFQGQRSTRSQVFLHDRCFAFPNRCGEPTILVSVVGLREICYYSVVAALRQREDRACLTVQQYAQALALFPNIGREVGSEPGTSSSFFGRRCGSGRAQFAKACAQRRRPVEDDVKLDDGDFDEDREACTALDVSQLEQSGLEPSSSVLGCCPPQSSTHLVLKCVPWLWWCRASGWAFL